VTRKLSIFVRFSCALQPLSLRAINNAEVEIAQSKIDPCIVEKKTFTSLRWLVKI
jgi:hypothetical protein